MINLKTTLLSSVVVIVLASCGASKNASNNATLMIQAPVNVQKKAPLKKTELNRWSHLDIIKDTIPGMSVDKAYAELLQDKKGKNVIVAIVDSGVDIEHEDLKAVIWTNKKEIAGNGIDDDKNGYIDDIHGWNFLGNITKENVEYERIIANKSLVNEATYQEALAANDKNIALAKNGKARLEQTSLDVTNADLTLVKHFGKTGYSVQEVNAIDSQDAEIVKSKTLMQRLNSMGMSLPEYKVSNQNRLEGYNKVLNGDNLKSNYRIVVGDNPEDIKDTKYGNNNPLGAII